ncbi:MAG TPA: Uma2 family endonuclease [Blastocatellia bacterium]|nr:Uma2 family endonuclease [Blastocatellia bacterium]
MITKTAVSIEKLIDRLSRTEGKAEIINGEVLEMPATGFLPGRASGRIFRSLDDHEQQNGGGYAIPDNVGFIVDLPNRNSFSPDAAFYLGPPTGGKFINGAPAFAAEVRSEWDYGKRSERMIAQKIADYFEAGTIVVWDVDVLREEIVRVYHRDDPNNPTIFRRGEIADVEPAVPGWRFPVDEMFR